MLQLEELRIIFGTLFRHYEGEESLRREMTYTGSTDRESIKYQNPYIENQEDSVNAISGLANEIMDQLTRTVRFLFEGNVLNKYENDDKDGILPL